LPPWASMSTGYAGFRKTLGKSACPVFNDGLGRTEFDRTSNRAAPLNGWQK
jgi:hypothetical protein